jgi:hypothetical protein
VKVISSKSLGFATLLSMVLVLEGCGTPPRTANEFRTMAKDGGMIMSTESLVVKRPLQQVVDAYAQRAPQCLNKTIETRRRQGGTAPITYTEIRAYKVTVLASSKQMECGVQSKVIGGNTYELGDPPKDGFYYMVVDAYPVDAGSTRIVISKSIATSDTIIQAAKNWANGDSMGCPDMTQ